MKAASIALVDPDSRRRAAICYSFSRGRVFVEPFESLEELPANRCECAPVLIFDQGPGVSRIREFMEERQQWVPFVAFAEEANVSADRIVSAIKAGALHYLAWPFAPATVIELLDRIESEAERAADEWAREHHARNQVARLTRRERQVLRSMVDGFSNKRIAEHLGISLRTVETHRAQLMRKLGVAHSSDALYLGIRARIDEI